MSRLNLEPTSVDQILEPVFGGRYGNLEEALFLLHQAWAATKPNVYPLQVDIETLFNYLPNRLSFTLFPSRFRVMPTIDTIGQAAASLTAAKTDAEQSTFARGFTLQAVKAQTGILLDERFELRESIPELAIAFLRDSVSPDQTESYARTLIRRGVLFGNVLTSEPLSVNLINRSMQVAITDIATARARLNLTTPGQ